MISDLWRPDPDMVREVEKQFTAQIEACERQPRLVEEQANHEESIRTGGYARIRGDPSRGLASPP